MPLSLFATARGHWAERECCLLVLNLVSSTLFWLRVSIERHCQFSREASLHRAKKNEGSCTPSLGYLLSPLASHTLKWMHVCAGGEAPSPFPTGANNVQPVLYHAGVVSAQSWVTGELCVAVSPIFWQRNMALSAHARAVL